MKKFIFIVLVAAAAAAFFMLGVAEGEAMILYDVKRGDYEETILVQGSVEPFYYVGIKAPDSPYEKQLTFIAPEGSFVKKGDVIARFDEGAVLTAIEAKEEHLYNRQFELENIEVSWDIEEYEMSVGINSAENQLALFFSDTQSLAGFYPSMFDLANLQYSSARSQYKASRVRKEGSKQMNEDRISRHKGVIRHNEFRIFRDEMYLEDYTIVSPIDSMVMLPYKYTSGKWRQAEVGDLLARGYEFMQLPDFDNMCVAVKIEQGLIKNISKGDSVSFIPVSDKKNTFAGTVDSISSLATEDPYREHKKLFDVRIKIESEDDKKGYFLPGMVVEVAVKISDAKDSYAIPKDYVFEKGGEKFVRVFDERKSSSSDVKLEAAREAADYYFVPASENPSLQAEFKIAANLSGG